MTRQHGIRHKPEAAREPVAVDVELAIALTNPHAFEPHVAERLDDMRIGPIGGGDELRGLRKLRRPAPPRPEPGHVGPCGLFEHVRHARAGLPGRRRARQQQRPAARDHRALPAHVEAVLDQRLQAACAGDTRQRPARKRQQQLACAAAENQRAEIEQQPAFVVFEQQRAGCVSATMRVATRCVTFGCRNTASRSAAAGVGIAAAPCRQICPPARGLSSTIATVARCARRPARPTARPARADDRDVDAQSFLFHRVRSTCMPSRRVWQASRRRPSIVILHSWQMPIPQNGARAAPVHDTRVVSSPLAATAAATSRRRPPSARGRPDE